MDKSVSNNGGTDKPVSLKELREKFYELRDLEIQNLWQRASIFAGLIGLFFAGYGYILVLCLSGGTEKMQKTEYAHILCCGIAILAIIFSVIWIAMAKGAKAWFEVQERKICEIEEEEELAIPARFRMGALPYPGIDSEPNDCLFSMRGGGYSVSKLNVLLGQILLVLWCLILWFHMTLLIVQKPFTEIVSCLVNLFSHPTLCQFLIALVVTIFLVVIPYLLPKRAKSGALLTQNEYSIRRLRLLKYEIERLLSNSGDVSGLMDWIDKQKKTYDGLSINLDDYQQKLEEIRGEVKQQIDTISLAHVSRKEMLEKKTQLQTEIFAFFRSVVSARVKE